MASTSAPSAPVNASASTSVAAAEPSNDVLASIITQVSPTGQPARAPARRKPTKPAQAKTAAQPARKPSTSASKPAPLPSTSPATKQAEAGVSSPSEKALPSSPAPAPASGTVRPTAPTPARAASPRKRKRKAGFLDGLFAFLTCSSPAHQAGNYDDKASSTRKIDPDGSAKAASSVVSPAATAPKAAKTSPPVVAPAKELPSTAVPSMATVPTPATVDAEALATQEAVANTSREGATLPRDETADVLSGAVVPPGKEAPGQTTPGRGTKARRRSARASTGTAGAATADVTGGTQDEEGSEVSEEEEEEEFATEEDDEDRLIAQGGMGIPIDENGHLRPLLTEIGAIDTGRKCLVLDLDETLVHSSFKMIHSADFVVPVEIENQSHNVYVIKRPGVDVRHTFLDLSILLIQVQQFLKQMGEIYEVVVFTASLSKYADPVLDHLDIHRVVRHRLFRESCYNHKGNYVKDLSQLGRPIGDTIIIDNSPASYIFHPKNAVPVSSWFNDPHDTELTDLLGVLTDLADVPDVRGVLDNYLDQETDLGQTADSSMGDLDAQLLGKTSDEGPLPPPVSEP